MEKIFNMDEEFKKCLESWKKAQDESLESRKNTFVKKNLYSTSHNSYGISLDKKLRIVLLTCTVKMYPWAEALNKIDCQTCAVIPGFNEYISKCTLPTCNSQIIPLLTIIISSSVELCQTVFTQCW